MNKFLIFIHEIFEDLELLYPKYRLIEAGFDVVIAGPEAKTTYQGKHGYPCTSDVAISSVNPEEFIGLVIPGGFAPDKLRRDPKVLEITRQIAEAKKPVAFICHAGWVPISAKVLKGVRCTSVSAIKDDLINAGALWEDAPVVVDKNFVSSRKPDDLPQFMTELLKFMKANV